MLNCALIGLGMVADTHLAALADLKDSIHLRGVFSAREESRKAFVAKANNALGHTPTAYDSFESLADDRLDFVIIATPPNARKKFVTALCRKGIPILMEKPIERDAARAAELVDLCKDADLQLGIILQLRARSVISDLRAALPKLGALHIAQAEIPWWRHQTYYDVPGRGTYERDGGGVLINQAIHTLDLMLTLTGPVTHVQALAATTGLHNMESEDFVSAGIQFQNGAVGSIIASTANFPGGPETITLHYTNGVAILKGGQLMINWRDGTTESFGLGSGSGGGADPMAFTHEWHRDIIADFARAITEGSDPMITGEDALEVHTLIDALVESSATGTRVKVRS